MTLENLATARDWAVIILAVQAILVSLVVLYMAWQAQRAMRRARPKVASSLQHARHAVINAAQRARRGAFIVACPFVQASSLGAGIRAGWAAWRRGPLQRR